MVRWLLVAALLAPLSMTAAAGEPEVVFAGAESDEDGTFTVSVTVRHADEGWDHYVDGWEIVGPDGAILAKRVLLHPHVAEQPFTRLLSNVRIPLGVDQVTVRAHDKVHGYGGRSYLLKLPHRR